MSDNDSGGGGEGLGMLLILVIGALIAIVGWIVALIIEHREEIVAGGKWLVQTIWRIHLALGRTLLFVLRDLPVRYFWDDGCTDRLVRGALIFWLAAPLFLLGAVLAQLSFLSGIVWLILGKAAAIKIISVLGSVYLWLLPSIAAAIYGYYKSYFTQSVQHYRWPRFVFQSQLACTEMRLAWVLRTTQAQLWLAIQKAALMRTCATWLVQIAARLDLTAAQVALGTSE